MRLCVCALLGNGFGGTTGNSGGVTTTTNSSNSQQQLSALKLLSLTLKISLKLSKTFNVDGKEAAGAGRAGKGGVDKATINVKRCWLLALFARSLPRLPVSLSLSAVGACQTKQTQSRKRTTERERERKREQQKNCSILCSASRRKCPLSKLIRPTCVQATVYVCVCFTLICELNICTAPAATPHNK